LACFVSSQKIPNRYGALNVVKGYGSGWVSNMIRAMSMVSNGFVSWVNASVIP